MGETIALIAVLVVAPLGMILHYVTKWKQSSAINGEDEKMLRDLWETAKKMEARIHSLETILDDEVPEWRDRT